MAYRHSQRKPGYATAGRTPTSPTQSASPNTHRYYISSTRSTPATPNSASTNRGPTWNRPGNVISTA